MFTSEIQMRRTLWKKLFRGFAEVKFNIADSCRFNGLAYFAPIRFFVEYKINSVYGGIYVGEFIWHNFDGSRAFFLILNCRCFSRMRTEKIFYCSKSRRIGLPPENHTNRVRAAAGSVL